MSCHSYHTKNFLVMHWKNPEMKKRGQFHTTKKVETMILIYRRTVLMMHKLHIRLMVMDTNPFQS